MTHDPQPVTDETGSIVHLPATARDLLAKARSAGAGRAARTLTPGAGAALKQTLLALVAGRTLADHESPGDATIQVLAGRVRLTGGGAERVLAAGDHASIPPVRHGLASFEDAVVLISVAQASAAQPDIPGRRAERPSDSAGGPPIPDDDTAERKPA